MAVHGCGAGQLPYTTIMRKYGGELIYRTKGRDGILEIVEDAMTRSLHFGNDTRQSSMLLSEPAALVLNYCRAMMAALLFVPQPHRILMIGLGAGSLAQFLHRHFPDAVLDVVEARRDVIQTAYRYFSLPRTDAIRVHASDGVAFMRDAGATPGARFDLVLLDAFNRRGIDEDVNSRAGFALASGLLAARGCMAVNVSTLQALHYRQTLRALRSVYPGRALRLPVLEKANQILLGLAEGFEPPSSTILADRAERLAALHGLEYRQFAGTLIPDA